jgi:hypothetical protein
MRAIFHAIAASPPPPVARSGISMPGHAAHRATTARWFVLTSHHSLTCARVVRRGPDDDRDADERVWMDDAIDPACRPDRRDCVAQGRRLVPLEPPKFHNRLVRRSTARFAKEPGRHRQLGVRKEPWRLAAPCTCRRIMSEKLLPAPRLTAMPPLFAGSDATGAACHFQTFAACHRCLPTTLAATTATTAVHDHLIFTHALLLIARCARVCAG